LHCPVDPAGASDGACARLAAASNSPAAPDISLMLRNMVSPSPWCFDLAMKMSSGIHRCVTY
jgi:hypothetical protein